MLRGLVDYAGESEDENEEKSTSPNMDALALGPVKRKGDLLRRPDNLTKKFKTLPKLDASLFTPAPLDDPSKHQGRKRTIPYVEGQFIAHVYVPIKLEGEFLALLRNVVQCAQATDSAWHSLLEPMSSTTAQQDVPHSSSKFYSHLSLSRPVPLRAHQRDDFRKEVRRAALERNQFPVSFVQLMTLTNDDKSRTFLSVEIGAGHKEFQALSQSLNSHLTSLRQLSYYSQPRFHISIAWILTPNSSAHSSGRKEPRSSDDTAKPEEDACKQELDTFFSAVAFMVDRLQMKFSKPLLALGKLDMETTPKSLKALPFKIKLPGDFDPSTIAQYISELKLFLTSPLVKSLVLAHPNEVATRGKWTSEPNHDFATDWWIWAGQVDTDCRGVLVEALIRSAMSRSISQDTSLHPSLRDLIDQIARLRLPRDAETILGASPTANNHRTLGMSPKKAHEVDRLSNLINETCAAVGQSGTRLIVDVGAGQGYLSHKLAERAGTRILALDGDEGQTEGATLRGKGFSHAERQRVRKDEGHVSQEYNEQLSPVTHQTLFITSDSLLHAIDQWVASLKLDRTCAPHPVLITGLHACGSLTPAVLRCFVDLYTRSGQATCDEREWAPGALVLVGCCYNLMRNSGDFPLSKRTCTHMDTKLELTPNHLQLAAQCPAQWCHSQSEMQRASLARRKIVWRALLARLIHIVSSKMGSSKKDEHPGRLGRLPDRAYASWDVFIRTASSKMGLSSSAMDALLSASSVSDGQSEFHPQTGSLAFQLEVLHILRALIGPVIESLIIVDRVSYLAEQLALSNRSSDLTVRAVNVFDQLSSGSARNIALVIEPVVESVMDFTSL